jgi:hypothetical protein
VRPLQADIVDNVEAASGAVQFKRGWVEKHAPFFEVRRCGLTVSKPVWKSPTIGTRIT